MHLIAGGVGKGQDFAPLAPLVAGHCAAVYLIGEAAREIGRALEGVDVPVHEMVTLPAALAAASEIARPGETVLLSPACASFDQYTDFEARGDAFRELVAAL